MRVRLISGIVALLLLGLGAVGLLVRHPAAYDYGTVVVGFAAVVATVMGLRAAKSSWDHAREETLPTETETLVAVPAPGDDIDRLLRLATLPRPYAQERQELHRRVVGLVRSALVVYEGYAPDAASAAIGRGTWTDDPIAARYVAGRVHRGTLWQQLRRRLGTADDRELGVRRALGAVAELVPGGSFEPPDDGDGAPLGDLMSGVTAAAGGAIETQHWRGIGVVALAGLGGGVALENPALLLAGGIGLGYTAYARAGAPPALDLEVEREFSNPEPTPGEPFEVAVTVRNAGDHLIPDVRIVDQLPDGVRVVDGIPRQSAVLPSSGTATLRYRVEAYEGTYRFEGVRVIARSLNGSYERADTIREDVDLTCAPDPRPVEADVPLRSSAARYVGQLPTETGGEGIEFQAVRDYRPGDRLSRIDWSRFARTEELTTIDFREEKAATIVMVIDAREAAYLAPGPDAVHAVQRSIGAADRLLLSLVGAGHRVGLASMSPVEPCWQSPSASRDVRAEVRELLTTHESLTPAPPSGEFRPFGWVEWFAARVPKGAQVVLFSPLCDRLIEESIIRIEARGHPVTILSPDPTTDETIGRQMARLDRQVTIDALRRRGIRIVDWPHGEPIDMSLERLAGRWSG